MISIKDILFVIPARGGSKGIPNKNIRLLNKKPLILYSLEYARKFTTDENICVSTDSLKIIRLLEKSGYKAPFIRPAAYAGDKISTFKVLLHTLKQYPRHKYKFICLLQPTSPFRNKNQFKQMLKIISAEPKSDMLVTVSESKHNPYFNLFEETAKGTLIISKSSTITRRQDAPPVYSYNGLIYLININSLYKYKSLQEFPVVKKFITDPKYNVDIDTPHDLVLASLIGKKYNY